MEESCLAQEVVLARSGGVGRKTAFVRKTSPSLSDEGGVSFMGGEGAGGEGGVGVVFIMPESISWLLARCRSRRWKSEIGAGS